MHAKDLMVEFVAVGLDDSLDNVQAVFEKYEYPEIPVMDDSLTIVGFIRPGQVISEYHRALLRKNQHEKANRKIN